MAKAPEKDVEIPKNVIEFLDKCSVEVGKYKADEFNMGVFTSMREDGIESPIEQLLYAAIRTIQALNYIEDADPVQIDGKWVPIGFGIYPQYKIGKYRGDFMICVARQRHNEEQKVLMRELIVECDSQEFHERTERERRYEKDRDRFLMSKGWKVFHYTGKQILEDSMKIAKEIVVEVTGMDPEYISTDANY